MTAARRARCAAAYHAPVDVPGTAPEPAGAEAAALPGRTFMRQCWRDLTFVHWRADPELVAPLMPPGIRVDVYDGAAWVGLIPFRMVSARIGPFPAAPWLGTFAETNVRLYGVDESGRRGVVFLSLDASRLPVVLAARLAFGLPYSWARMRVREDAGQFEYSTRRRWPEPRGRGGRLVVRPGSVREPGDPLADFLTARWGLYTRRLGRILYVPIHHEVWPLHDAALVELDDTLVSAAGLPFLAGREPDSVLWSPGVTTDFGLPRRRRPVAA